MELLDLSVNTMEVYLLTIKMWLQFKMRFKKTEKLVCRAT